MQSTIALSLIAAILAGGAAIAQSPEHRQPRYVAKFDAKFKAADLDGDGALSRDEAQAAGLDRIVQQFSHIDTNRDGRVTRQELRAFLVNRLSS